MNSLDILEMDSEEIFQGPTLSFKIIPLLCRIPTLAIHISDSYLILLFIYVTFRCSCNNFGQCDILAQDFDFGPDPCPDTERYLEASYICVLGTENDQMSSAYEGM